VVAGLAFAFLNRRNGEKQKFDFTDILISIPIVLIAYIAGYLTGISGSSAVGNLVPATLAFIGGLNVYLFGVQTNYKALSMFAIFLFAIILFYGVLDGGYARINDREQQMQVLADQMQESAAEELRIRTYRQNLNLPPDPPSWFTFGQ
jgi:hypothetical protein